MSCAHLRGGGVEEMVSGITGGFGRGEGRLRGVSGDQGELSDNGGEGEIPKKA